MNALAEVLKVVLVWILAHADEHRPLADSDLDVQLGVRLDVHHGVPQTQQVYRVLQIGVECAAERRSRCIARCRGMQLLMSFDGEGWTPRWQRTTYYEQPILKVRCPRRAARLKGCGVLCPRQDGAAAATH